jgi:hypothetical protein
VKASQRLDYSNLAAALGQRGAVEPARLNLALQTSHQGPIPFPEVLVSDGTIGDWELSRVVCDLYGLPFLPVEIYPPNPKAMAGLDINFLREHRLIPIERHGQLLTVCMPALVPADVLGQLAADADVQVMPVVGTVQTNNRWLAENMALTDDPANAHTPGHTPTDWSNIFDQANAAVMEGLIGDMPGGQPSDTLPPLPPLGKS